MARRSGTRYLGILRGSDEVARNRLIQYFKGEIKPTYPARSKARPDQQQVFVKPFGIPLTASKVLVQEVNSARFAGVKAFVAGFTDDTATAANQVKLPGLRSPRAVIVTERSATGTSQTSKISGRAYKSAGGKGISVPFGEGETADQKSEEQVFQIILARVKAAQERNTCSFVPGSYSLT